MCVGDPIIVSTNIKRLTTYVWNRIIAESRRTDTYIASCDVLPIIIGDHLKRRHNTKKRRRNTTSLRLFISNLGDLIISNIRATTTMDRPYDQNQFHKRILRQLRITNYALWIDHYTHVRASLREFPDVWIIPTITHYEL